MAFSPIDLQAWEERDGKKTLPLAIQVHHAVCDGYHVGLFVEHLRQTIEQHNWR